MTTPRRTVWVVLAMLLGVPPLRADGAARGAFSFAPGTRWTYEGTVRSTDDRNRPFRVRVRFTSDVVDAFDAGRVAGALLRGGVEDVFPLTTSPIRRHAYAVLRVAARYYLVPDGRAAFARARASYGAVLPDDLYDHVWFEVPVRPGRWVRPDDFEHGRTHDGWLVEGAPSVNVAVGGVPATTRRGFVLNYRELASDMRVTIVPGVGITRFTYSHHGTLDEVDLRLVAAHVR